MDNEIRDAWNRMAEEMELQEAWNKIAQYMNNHEKLSFFISPWDSKKNPAYTLHIMENGEQVDLIVSEIPRPEKGAI